MAQGRGAERSCLGDQLDHPRVQMTARTARLHKLNELNTPCGSCPQICQRWRISCASELCVQTLSVRARSCLYWRHVIACTTGRTSTLPNPRPNHPMLVACYFHWSCLAHEAEIHPSLAQGCCLRATGTNRCDQNGRSARFAAAILLLLA